MKKILAVLLAAAMFVLPLGGISFAANADSLEIEQEWQNFDFGNTHSGAIHVGGHANAWGYNYNGPVGNGSGIGVVSGAVSAGRICGTYR